MFGGRVFKCNADVHNQQKAKLDGIIKGLRFVVFVQWDVFRFIGENTS